MYVTNKDINEALMRFFDTIDGDEIEDIFGSSSVTIDAELESKLAESEESSRDRQKDLDKHKMYTDKDWNRSGLGEF